MKKYLFLLAAILTTGFTACSDDPTIAIQESSEIQKIETNDYETIVNVARHSVSGLQGEAASRARSLTVESFTSYPELSSRADNTSPKLHIVNFLEGGFAIVGDIHDGYCVYAMSDEGSFDPQPGSAPEFFMELAYQHQQDNSSIPDSIGEPITIKPGLEDKQQIVWHGDHYCRRTLVSENTSEKTLMLLTNWRQSEPFNKFCFTNDGKKAPTGCVPLAMAQIMAFHKKPYSYNNHIYRWDLINYLLTYQRDSIAQNSIAYLTSDIGIALHAKYSIDQTSASSADAPNVFKSFGYSNVSSLKPYDYASIHLDLQLRRPVLIRGNETNENIGHAWVLDGEYQVYKVYRYVNDETNAICEFSVNSQENYLHCNWGWGSGNCYCLSGVFNPRGHLYTSGLKIVTNIY